MTRREKQWRRILSTSLLDATVPSDEVSSNSDCENRTVIKIEKNWKRHAGTWLSRLPLTKMEISAGTSSWPSRISHFTGSFVGHSPSEMLCPPAWKLKKIIKSQTKQVVHRNQRKEVLHLFRWSTHTHASTHPHILNLPLALRWHRSIKSERNGCYCGMLPRRSVAHIAAGHWTAPAMSQSWLNSMTFVGKTVLIRPTKSAGE